MPRYLTPERYRYSYAGLVEPASTLLNDVALAFLIEQAESAIDAYLGFPLQLGGLEPHVVYGWQQPLDGVAAGTWRRRVRIPLFPAPARNLVRFNIHITNVGGSSAQASTAILSPTDIVINNLTGYFEAVPLQAILYSPLAAVWGLGLDPPIAEVDYESGYYLPYLGEALYDQGDHQTYRALRGMWATTYTLTGSAQPSTPPPTPAVIYKNGVVVASGITVNPQEGTVFFAVANAASDLVSADYTTQIPAQVQTATIEQVSYLINQRTLNLLGMGGLEQLKTQESFGRRSRTDDVMEDQLCAKARMKLAGFRRIPLAGA
ncbi:MAG: hypothetical protein KGK07_16020 [Chloroflexota bacterium]|nr:hypothetical protein [Chloroflexota bacterium]